MNKMACFHASYKQLTEYQGFQQLASLSGPGGSRAFFFVRNYFPFALFYAKISVFRINFSRLWAAEKKLCFFCQSMAVFNTENMLN